MKNHTITTFIVLALMDDPQLQILIIVFLFLTYMLSITGNLTIIFLTSVDPHLGSDGKVSACNAGDLHLIPGSGRALGEGNGNPLQYSCKENSMVGGAWQAPVNGVAKSQT